MKRSIILIMCESRNGVQLSVEGMDLDRQMLSRFHRFQSQYLLFNHAKVLEGTDWKFGCLCSLVEILVKVEYVMDCGVYSGNILTSAYVTEASPRQYRGISHALSSVFHEEGPRALYKGWLPSVIGVIPYVGLNFSVYESLKDWLIKTRPFGLVEDSELSVTTKLACGAAAGTVGQTVAYPLDVIRRRMQMVGWKDAASLVTGDGKSKAPLEYSGMVDAFRKTVRHEGFRALYKGLVPNSVKVVPSIAIAFVTYEAVKDVLGVEMKISD
ncbi:hypothetical protein TEA_026675 [Camellia sinensis var. sinensis]|uniref:Uncharacterized protein n=1 Tax=Camellia sinensis var. sinensis TaxID=542762 RepID=A0A4S4EZS0_CAMSN|nr:hypothetical protein TEA_026675 [Camellia sinensis var. sinensis]